MAPLPTFVLSARPSEEHVRRDDRVKKYACGYCTIKGVEYRVTVLAKNGKIVPATDEIFKELAQQFITPVLEQVKAPLPSKLQIETAADHKTIEVSSPANWKPVTIRLTVSSTLYNAAKLADELFKQLHQKPS